MSGAPCRLFSSVLPRLCAAVARGRPSAPKAERCGYGNEVSMKKTRAPWCITPQPRSPHCNVPYRSLCGPRISSGSSATQWRSKGPTLACGCFDVVVVVSISQRRPLPPGTIVPSGTSCGAAPGGGVAFTKPAPRESHACNTDIPLGPKIGTGRLPSRRLWRESTGMRNCATPYGRISAGQSVATGGPRVLCAAERQVAGRE
mmetsp:Transcript_89264/g.230398  ORF Transcript_89264/g.230398 Transcript_89264/m.230398 type:complete len:202 (-) Transcript_89264:672-1277(-)